MPLRAAIRGTARARSDRLALDFAATLVFRGSEHPSQLLDSPGRLAGWALAGGVVSAAAPCEAEVLREATRLRESIYRTAFARTAGHLAGPGDIKVLNHYGTTAPVTVALDPGGMITRSGTMHAVLATIARDAIELLVSGHAKIPVDGHDGSRPADI